MATTDTRPPTFYTSTLLTYQEGQQAFQVTDPERTPLTVLRRLYGACRRREIVVLQHPHRDKPVEAYPHRLVHVDETLRPTRAQLNESVRQLSHMVNVHTDGCSACQRQAAWWGTCYRCLIGTRMIEAVGNLTSYLRTVHPWLVGDPIDPARAGLGDQVIVRAPGQPEFAAIVATMRFPDDGGTEYHEPGKNGQILIAMPDGKTRRLFPVDQVHPKI